MSTTNNHLVGDGSLFDSDMFFIDTVVNFHNRSNVEDIDALYYYYMSALITYWTKVERLYSLTEEEAYNSVDMNADGYRRNFKNIQDEFSIYRDTYLQNLNKVTQTYVSNRRLNVNLVVETFNMMSSLLCFSYPRSISDEINFRNEDDYDYIMSRVYPLVNDTGVFSINGYLYAFVNDIILLGIPSQVSSFDNIEGCPNAFLIHDTGHLESQYASGILYRAKDVEELYYVIIDDRSLSRNKKEYLLFALWFSIHEVYYFGPFNDLNEQYRSILFEHNWFDVKEEDYSEMSKYSFDGRVTMDRYSQDQNVRLLSIMEYYSNYYNKFYEE